jgi:hypothetical protein
MIKAMAGKPVFAGAGIWLSAVAAAATNNMISAMVEKRIPVVNCRLNGVLLHAFP